MRPSLQKKQFEPLPSPSQIKALYPATTERLAKVQKFRQEIADILAKKNDKLLLIIGPCSIHDTIAAREYASHLKKLQEEVSDIFFIVMRVYCEKARSHLGWKGMMYDPHLDHSHDIEAGIKATRALLIDLLDLGIPAGTEFVEPLASAYTEDLIAWGSIGARTSSSQIHRQFASGLAAPVAFKNSTDGNVQNAIHGVIAASAPQSYIGIGEDGNVAAIHTSGNPHCHIVLRGGDEEPNFDEFSVEAAKQQLLTANLTARLIIDCSHGNSQKQFTKQSLVFEEAIRQIYNGNSPIAGLMLESHLHAGRQNIQALETPLKYGISLTDACLDWQTTEELIRNAHANLTSMIGGLT